MGLKKKISSRSGASKLNRDEISDIVRRARQAEEERMKGYREQSLRIHPWVCARCGREFTRKNLHMLTVHHRDHNHNNNPSDGSNWENLCIYCHDNEHSRYIDHVATGDTEIIDEKSNSVTHQPFAGLEEMLKKK